jgi:hypothetical protein
MSYKNILQEFYQKKGDPVPRYVTRKVGGQPHQPIWSSIVLVADGSTYYGEELGDKKAAEQSAAKVAYESVIGTVSTRATVKEINNKIIIFVDGENKPNFVQQFYEHYKAPNSIVKFYTTDGHPSQSKIKQFINEPNFELHVAYSTRPNSVDTLILIDLGRNIDEYCDYQFVLASSDKFASAAAENLTNEKLSVISVREFEQLQKYIV